MYMVLLFVGRDGPAVVIFVLGTKFSREGSLSHISLCERGIDGERILIVPAPVPQWLMGSNVPAWSLPK